jgi:predicted HTH transcriptional regulator
MHLPISIDNLLHNSIVESDRLEFKADWNPESVLHTICAFANDRYYIRKASSTVLVKNEELKELLQLTATVPFDDRINHHSKLEDLKLPLIQSFLKEVNSELLKESRTQALADICRQMAIIDGGKIFEAQKCRFALF